MNKIFDYHIECGKVDNNLCYARTIIGGFQVLKTSPFISEAIFRVNADVDMSGMFNSLFSDPKYSVFPFPPSVTIPSAWQKQFDLHFEFGKSTPINPHTSKFIDLCYARTLFLPSSVVSSSRIKHYYDEVELTQLDYTLLFSTLVIKIKIDGMFDILERDPAISTYPIPSLSISASSTSAASSIPKAVPVEESKKEIKRQLPSEIIDIPHPQCQNHCTSWDIFGAPKCRSICKGRKGL